MHIAETFLLGFVFECDRGPLWKRILYVDDFSSTLYSNIASAIEFDLDECESSSLAFHWTKLTCLLLFVSFVSCIFCLVNLSFFLKVLYATCKFYLYLLVGIGLSLLLVFDLVNCKPNSHLVVLQLG
jgi:hypothetical protein